MTGVEPRTSGIESDRSTNWATTTSQFDAFLGKETDLELLSFTNIRVAQLLYSKIIHSNWMLKVIKSDLSNQSALFQIGVVMLLWYLFLTSAIGRAIGWLSQVDIYFDHRATWSKNANLNHCSIFYKFVNYCYSRI